MSAHTLHQTGSREPCTSTAVARTTLVITGLRAYFLHRLGFGVQETRYISGSATLYGWGCVTLSTAGLPSFKRGVIVPIPKLSRSQWSNKCQVQSSRLKKTSDTHKTVLSLCCVHVRPPNTYGAPNNLNRCLLQKRGGKRDFSWSSVSRR